MENVVRQLSREQEAAAELAAGVRQMLQPDPILENAKRILKRVHTLKIVAWALAEELENGGQPSDKKALQDHLALLESLSRQCSTRAEFRTPSEFHAAAFKLCKLLEETPGLLADAMNLSFDALTDLRPGQAPESIANKRSLLAILRDLATAYDGIAAGLQIAALPLRTPEQVREHVRAVYRMSVFVLWVVSLAAYARFLGIMPITVVAALLYWFGRELIDLHMPKFEAMAKARERRRLVAIGIKPDRHGNFAIQSNGLALSTDYAELDEQLRAQGHDWTTFGEPA